MYQTVTAQKLGKSNNQSVGKLVEYLEKENIGLEEGMQENFFDQKNNLVAAETVIKEIDGNTKKLKKIEPKFYSLTINPSKKELEKIEEIAKEISDKQIKNKVPDSKLTYETILKNTTNHLLKDFVRESMKDYASSFKNEINGKPVTVNDIKYYAKIESTRTYKGDDRQVQENAPFRKELKKLELELSQINSGKIKGNSKEVEEKILKLHERAPHKINGKMIEQGMKKEGLQSHIHIIVSRKDASNNFSLSPGSKYKASESVLNGKVVKRGFDRDGWTNKTEKTFDKLFQYNRNYIESYQGRKDKKEDPKLYWEKISQLPNEQKNLALRMMGVLVEKQNSASSNIVRNLQYQVKNQVKKVIIPNEVKEAMAKVNSVRSGQIPNTNLSIKEINGFVKDANQIINLFSKGVVIPEPTLQAAKIVVKYAAKLVKVLTRGTGIEFGR